MKTIIKNLTFLSIVMLLFSCEMKTPEVVSQIKISVQMPDGIKSDVKFAGKTVTLKSQRMTYTATTDESGIATFTDIIPDIYSVYASWSLSAEEYVNLAEGQVESKSALISGTESQLNLFNEQSLSLKTLLSVKQSLLISKVYASGTRDINNARYIADQYIEIFNNSDDTQYLDGIYLAMCEGDSPMAFPASSNPDTLHAKQVYRFPGTGKEHPVLPGNSVILVNSARDHTTSSPNSVNLQNADFEFKGTKYANNVLVPGMTLIYTAFTSITEVNLTVGSVNSLVLFTSKDDVSKYNIVYAPGKTIGTKYMVIPAHNIIDGVDILSYRAAGIDVNTKRLQSFIDAGYTNISSTSGLTHQSMERKVDKTLSNGTRYYLIDTNNSTNDYVNLYDPTPKKYDKAALN